MPEKSSIFTEITQEEAIIELNRCKINGYAPTDWDKRCKAVEVGKQAINRCMVGRKPIREMLGGRCPNCNGTVFKIIDNYCNNCGQALDWNE